MKTRGVVPANVDDIKEIPGAGLEGMINGKPVRLGSRTWCDNAVDIAEEDRAPVVGMLEEKAEAAEVVLRHLVAVHGGAVEGDVGVDSFEPPDQLEDGFAPSPPALLVSELAAAHCFYLKTEATGGFYASRFHLRETRA